MPGVRPIFRRVLGGPAVGEVKLLRTCMGVRGRGPASSARFRLPLRRSPPPRFPLWSDVRDLRARGSFVPGPGPCSNSRSEQVNGRACRRYRARAGVVVRPTRWSVGRDPTLDFEFVARELTPMSSVSAGKRGGLHSALNGDKLDALLGQR